MLSFKSLTAASAVLSLLSGVNAISHDLVQRNQEPSQPSCTDFTPFVYAGCFQSLGSPDALLFRGPNNKNMTVETCVAFCKGNDYRYAGLEYYTECFCGASVYGPQVDESQCNAPCAGNASETCGANNRLNIYQDPTFPTVNDSVISDYQAIGCYSEGTNGRSLNWRQNQLSQTNLTVEACLFACKDNGFPMAGVEYGRECYCGEVLGNGTLPLNSSSCNMPCTGDSTETCGGRSTLNIYVATDLESSQPCQRVPPSSSSSTTVTSTTVSSTSSTSSVETTTSSTSSTSTTSTSIYSPPPTTSSTSTSSTSTSESSTSSSTSSESSPPPTTSSTSTSSTSTSIYSPPPTTSSTSTSSSSTSESSTSTSSSSTSTTSTSSSVSSTSTTSTSVSSTSSTTSSSIVTSTTSSTTTSSSIYTRPTTSTTSSKPYTTSSISTPPVTSTTSTKTTVSLCTSTYSTSPTPTCEWSCGKWCSSPIPKFTDPNSCFAAFSSCSVQVASCFLHAGWPDSLNCFQFSSWCNSISQYCGNACPGGNCNKGGCTSKYPPSGPPPPPPTYSTSVYTCPVTSTTAKPTTTPKPSSSSTSCVPIPTSSNICTQPSNPWKGYTSSSPVGNIALPCLTCNNLQSEYFGGKPFKLYTYADSSKCPSYPGGGPSGPPQGCKDACDSQYQSCMNTYAQGCIGSSRGDNYQTASQKCWNQWNDCYAANQNVNIGNRCSGWNSGWW